MTTKKMRAKIAELYRTVQDYESDTFSATGSRMTSKECAAVVEQLIIVALQELIDCDSLDGVRLSEILGDMRGDNE